MEEEVVVRKRRGRRGVQYFFSRTTPPNRNERATTGSISDNGDRKQQLRLYDMLSRTLVKVAAVISLLVAVTLASAPFRRVWHKQKIVAPTGRATLDKETQKRKIIYFVHVHKGGGTTMCALAKLNGEVGRFDTNCNVQPDWRCCGRKDTPEAQAEFAKTTNFTFVAAEKPMYESMSLDHYIYSVLLRDGYARYLSNYRHVYRGPKRWKGTFREWWSNFPDNWIFRQICGPACEGTPKFHLSMNQVDKTLARLRNFDHIMFLEDGEKALRSFATRFHWNTTTIDPQNTAPKKLSTVEEEKDMSWDPLMVALDDVLYEYARWLTKNVAPLGPWTTNHANKTFVRNILSPKRLWMLDRYMTEGVGRGCRNPCCAEKCSPK